MIYPFVAILPSAGVGKRFKSDKPKQYSLIDNKTVMEISLEPLLDFSECLGICIPVAPEDTHWKSIESLDNPKINFIKGGKPEQYQYRELLTIGRPLQLIIRIY